MEDNYFEKVEYDYFSNTSSYVKMIVKMLPESRARDDMKYAIKYLYNYFLNRFDEEKIKEIAQISSLFREVISVSSLESTAKCAEYIYSNFLYKIVFDSKNRDKIFDIMNESMKVYVGYYSQYQNDENKVNYIR